MAVKSYQDLETWRTAMDLVGEVYRVTKIFPKDELYGLTNQLRRAAVSVPSNIAEGQGRTQPKNSCITYQCRVVHSAKSRHSC
jgi:four helix bundle protein